MSRSIDSANASSDPHRPRPRAARISSSTEVSSHAGLGGPCLQPREVEQVVDQPREALRLLLDHAGHLRALLRRQRRGAHASPAAEIAVSGDAGRARPRAQRRLDGVARRSEAVSTTPAEQRLALERRAQQGLERRHDALLQPAQVGLGGAGRRPAASPAGWTLRAAETRPCARRLRQPPSRSPRLCLDVCAETRRGRRQRLGEARCRAAAAAPSPPPGRPRGGALSVAVRARSPPRRSRERATTRNAASATQFSESCSVTPDRRQVEEVEGRRADDGRGDAQPRAPVTDTTSTAGKYKTLSEATGATCASG